MAITLSPNDNNDNWAEKIWNQPGLLAEDGRLEAKGGLPDSEPYTPDSDSYDGSGLAGGHNYQVQAEITVTAQPIDGGKDIDELNASDSEDLYIPLNE